MAVNNEPLKITRDQLERLIHCVIDAIVDDVHLGESVRSIVARVWPPEEPSPEVCGKCGGDKVPEGKSDAWCVCDAPSGRPERPTRYWNTIAETDVIKFPLDPVGNYVWVGVPLLEQIHAYGDAEYAAGVAEGEKLALADPYVKAMCGADRRVLENRAEKAEAEVERLRADIEQRCAVAVKNARPVIADSVRRETVDRIKAGVRLDGGAAMLGRLEVVVPAVWYTKVPRRLLDEIERLAYPDKEDGDE